MGEHSWFSPSAASRLLRCPGSYRACLSIPDPGGEQAADGTACHSVMELYYKGVDIEGVWEKLKKPWQIDAIKMAQKQTDEFLKNCMEQYGSDPKMILEQKVTLGADETVFGTVDMLVWFESTRTLVVLDYKFGMGEVFAEGNEQLLTYAACASEQFDAATIVLAVVQPRVKYTPDVHVVPADELAMWMTFVLIPAIEKAKLPDAKLIPGEIQCQWCRLGRAKGCIEHLNWATEKTRNLVFNETPTATRHEIDAIMTADTDSRIPDNIEPDAPQHIAAASNEELSVVGLKLPAMKQVIKAIEEAITSRLLEGEEIPHFKLVRGDKRAVWTDEKKADGFLQRKGVSIDDRSPRKLVSPSGAKKLLNFKTLPAASKKAFSELFHTPLGDPVAVHISDKRDALTQEELAWTPVPEDPEVVTPAPEVDQSLIDAVNNVDVSSLF